MQENKPVSMSQRSHRQPPQRAMQSTRPSPGFRQQSIPFLWGLVILLLILNLALIYGLNLTRLKMIEALDKVETTLGSLAHEVVVYNFEIDQAVPMKADVPFERTMEIPVNTTIPIDQQLTVPFNTPAGEVTLNVPVKTDFPIDVVIPVDFNETISVDSMVQLNTTIPVEIDISQTPLVTYLSQARADVVQLKNRLAFSDEPIPPLEVPGGPTAKQTADQPEAPVAVSDAQAPAESDSSEPAASTTDTSSASSEAAAGVANSEAPASNNEACRHPYWPLQPGTTWTYNSPDTSYTQRVDNIIQNQTHLSTQYEGQDLLFQMGCLEQGVGLNYLGDMRRLSEFGDLTFSNPRGAFLPAPNIMTEIGRSWNQEIDVSGTVEGRQGDKPVIGHIAHGLARATYTPVSIDMVETPLGLKEAIRLEQTLELELGIDFDLNGQVVPATQIAQLTSLYWFAENIGLVKMHWQGGTLEQSFEIDQTPVSERAIVPVLAEEELVFVCLLLEGKSFECKQRVSDSQSNLTVAPASELVIPRFVFPETAASEAGSNDGNQTTGAASSNDENQDANGSESTGGAPTSSSDEASPGGEAGQSDLLAYAAAVAAYGEQISQAGEAFGASVIAYRDGQMTLEQFRAEFNQFSPMVRGPIQGVNQLSPPPEAAAIHHKLTGGLAKCDQGIDLMQQWLDTFDENTKITAAVLVTQCIDEVTTAGDELAALVEGD